MTFETLAHRRAEGDRESLLKQAGTGPVGNLYLRVLLRKAKFYAKDETELFEATVREAQRWEQGSTAETQRCGG